ncbi:MULTISPECIES: fimbria/pilus outer membrane usher protein [unclassified Brenneria]|uniref:fimbria/pilus outer membrane usher protein n=1 Tax=unclassified Brenneria TaxID=2634434 RepID=UPI0020A6C3C1|nr:fimbria/pilus outer membrane usher protein [Brenneria sp. hezel4-2-4]MEE3652295.1 fimbria/pilus outer membrane usher protein [Brenneria sp. HEZEL_4_2_4]
MNVVRPLGLLLSIIGLFCPGLNGIAWAESSARQNLLLSVVVNGQQREGIDDFVEDNGELFVTVTQLTRLGLSLPPSQNATNDELINLSTIQGWRYQLDNETQTLHLQIPNQNLVAQQLNAPQKPDSGSVPHSDNGAVLNYDTQMTHYAGQLSDSTTGDLRLFGNHGVFSTSGIRTNNPYLRRTVRLNSTYSVSDVEKLRTYNVGDFINSGLPWTRPIRMAGMQMTTNFSLRPDLVTFPRPGITGEVAVPSSVDIYVNGIHQLSSRVEPGPFEVTQLPVTSGGGEIAMVVKSANGRQIQQTLPFYTGASLLEKGLDSLAVETGLVRRRYATRSSDYTQSAAALSYRRGITSGLTLSSHLEGTEKLAMGGIGADLLISRYGILSSSLATSHFGNRQGSQYGLGFSHILPAMSYGISILQADKHFYDIAAANDDTMPGTTLRASIGFPVSPGKGSFSLIYAKRMVTFYNDYDLTSERIATSTLSATYSASLPFDSYGYITVLHDFDNQQGSGIFIGFSIPFGRRATISANSSISNGNHYQTVQARQSAVQRGDVGWKIANQSGSRARQNMALDYKSPWGLMGTEIERSKEGNAVRASAQGAISTLGGHFFASNTIHDSFGVVDTDGLSGITVLQENRPLGKTDRNGVMFIEALNAYENNHLSIDPNDVPMDVSLRYTELHLTPRDRAGVLAKFPVHRSNSATIRLVDSNHQPMPLGSTAILNENGMQQVIGYDGIIFFENLATHNTLSVQRNEHPACHVAFDYHPQPNTIPEIGPLTCLTGEKP